VTKSGATFQSSEKKTLLIIAVNQQIYHASTQRLTSNQVLHLLFSSVLSPLLPLSSPSEELQSARCENRRPTYLDKLDHQLSQDREVELTWIAPISSVMTVIRLSLAFMRVWVILMYRLEMKELTGVAMTNTTMPANADHPRILPCQLVLDR
jgi:hypothetical protein